MALRMFDRLCQRQSSENMNDSISLMFLVAFFCCLVYNVVHMVFRAPEKGGGMP